MKLPQNTNAHCRHPRRPETLVPQWSGQMDTLVSLGPGTKRDSRFLSGTDCGWKVKGRWDTRTPHRSNACCTAPPPTQLRAVGRSSFWHATPWATVPPSALIIADRCADCLSNGLASVSSAMPLAALTHAGLQTGTPTCLRALLLSGHWTLLYLMLHGTEFSSSI